MTRQFIRQQVCDAVDAQQRFIQTVQMQDEMGLSVGPSGELPALEYLLVEQQLAGVSAKISVN